MERDPFEEYYRQLEPSKKEKGNAWNTAIGLQAVDGLKTSDYLKDTVTYGSALDLKETLEYDLSVEREFSYKGLEIDDVIKHLARFVSNLWQIHVFKEGNTRTTAVFFIKYLRTLGFDATNATFAENAWYFRNALVRANYSNLQKGIHETTEYVEIFLRNLLLDEKNELHNREMHISGKYAFEKKPNIDAEFLIDIDGVQKLDNVSAISRKQIQMIYNELGKKEFFGRTNVEQLLNIKSFRANEIIKLMKELDIITPVQGKGKGKYRFKVGNK